MRGHFYFADASEFRVHTITSLVTVLFGSILLGVYNGDSSKLYAASMRNKHVLLIFTKKI